MWVKEKYILPETNLQFHPAEDAFVAHIEQKMLDKFGETIKLAIPIKRETVKSYTVPNDVHFTLEAYVFTAEQMQEIQTIFNSIPFLDNEQETREALSALKKILSEP